MDDIEALDRGVKKQNDSTMQEVSTKAYILAEHRLDANFVRNGGGAVSLGRQFESARCP